MRAQTQTALMPPPGYRRPTRVDETGLVVYPVDQHGAELGTYDFTGCPGPQEFRRALVEAFVVRGRRLWNSESTYRGYARALKGFMTWASELDPPLESVTHLTPALWAQWRLHSGRWNPLAVVIGEISSLPPITRSAVVARTGKPAPNVKRGYTWAELRRIRAAAARTVRTARRRIDDNTALLERWRAGGVQADSEDYRWGSLLDHLARTGNVPRYPCGQVREDVKALMRTAGGFAGTVTRLFPSETELGAAAILLVCHEAWNRSVLMRLQVPSHWPNADDDEEGPALYRVETDKPRRRLRRHSTNNLVDTGPGSAGWAMRQVLKMTSQARITAELIGSPSTSLFLARPTFATTEKGLFCDGRVLAWAIPTWAKQMAVEDAEFPPGVAASTVRHAVQILDGGPRNNTPKVHREAYVMLDAGVRLDAGDAVADGLADAVARARADVGMRVVDQVTGPGEDDADVLAHRTGIDRQTAAAVVAGKLDTAVAACTDYEHSPFTPSGPCSASFLLCFACPNALATERHLPRIIYLFHALEALRSVVSAAAWSSDWADHHARVKDLLERRTTDEARRILLTQLSDRDKDLIDRMLERRLDS